MWKRLWMHVAAVAMLMALSGIAKADVVLTIDLRVPDQIMITATAGLSAGTVSGPDQVGFYMENFYTSPGSSLGFTVSSGDLTNFLNPSDGSPVLFRVGSGSDVGLNVYSFSSDENVDFTAGVQAFTGSATWTLDHTAWLEMVAGNLSGNVYFVADSADDVAAATRIGTYMVLTDVVTVDLRVPDQITITATDGLSAGTVGGSDGVGFYIENFYSSPGVSPTETLVSGDLTNFLNPSDGSPDLFRGGSGIDPGLNVYNFSSDDIVDFTAGVQAFTGSATWTLDHAAWLDMLAGNLSGNVYFPADVAPDVASATLIGGYRVLTDRIFANGFE